jgi:hypothetical protein
MPWGVYLWHDFNSSYFRILYQGGYVVLCVDAGESAFICKFWHGRDVDSEAVVVTEVQMQDI